MYYPVIIPGATNGYAVAWNNKINRQVIFFGNEENVITYKSNCSYKIPVFKTYTLLTGKKLPVTKNEPDDFKLFIPCSQLSLFTGKTNARKIFGTSIAGDAGFYFCFYQP